MAFSIIEWIILIALVVTGIGLTGGIFLKKNYQKRWNFTYNVLEDAEGTGHNVPTRKGRCRLVKISDSGVEIFYLPKEKKYRTAYGRRSGKNHIVWSIDAAGYWHNVYFGSVDKKLQELGVNIVSPQARLAEASIRKVVKDSYESKDFMTKYGILISFGLLFICIIALGVSQYMSYNQQAKVAGINAKTLETVKDTTSAQKDVIEATSKLITKLDVMQSGGSGFIPATP